MATKGFKSTGEAPPIGSCGNPPKAAQDRCDRTAHELVGCSFNEFDERVARTGRIARKQHSGIIGLDHPLDHDIGLAVLGAVGGDAPVLNDASTSADRGFKACTIDVEDRLKHAGKAVRAAVLGAA